ncbi:MAG: orotidine-5'-phosphate decarboxylase [Proteobacteria bacterium]|nr:orotidine-5'-phosphate decarboxylase [Pseudomonadota bacterium]MDA1332465.1 orotidine-5'-phosphate decarboxylase [Pseudomonadota bacterium]
MKSKVIVAVDFSNEKHLMSFVDLINPELCGLKIGKELFTALGPRPVEMLVKKGFSVFLDLKYHDIPNTVERACAAARDLGVWMVNVHALGGAEMIQAARSGLGNAPNRSLLTAVTILTSMDAAGLKTIGFNQEPLDMVKRLAHLAQKSGADGVVCSASEVKELNMMLGDTFIKVTPGIRPSGSATDDQKRVMTPSEAIKQGADYLVIGRPITQAQDPVSVLNLVIQDIENSI